MLWVMTEFFSLGIYLNKHDQINRFNLVLVLQSMHIYYIKIKNICQINIKNHSQAQDT